MTGEALLRVEAAGVVLEAERAVPADATGVVIIVDGARRARMSRRHRAVGEYLNQAGLATVLLDVLTAAERRVLDASLISGRLCGVLDWVASQPATAGLPCGLLCSGTAVQAGLLTVTRRGHQVDAFVGWDGRPSLGAGTLAQVTTPTLLAVQLEDRTAVQACEHAAGLLAGVCKLHRMTGDGGNGEESAVAVAEAAAAWFREHMRPDDAPIDREN